MSESSSSDWEKKVVSPVDYKRIMSIVGFVEVEPGIERIIAEARYVLARNRLFAD